MEKEQLIYLCWEGLSIYQKLRDISFWEVVGGYFFFLWTEKQKQNSFLPLKKVNKYTFFYKNSNVFATRAHELS